MLSRNAEVGYVARNRNLHRVRQCQSDSTVEYQRNRLRESPTAYSLELEFLISSQFASGRCMDTGVSTYHICDTEKWQELSIA